MNIASIDLIVIIIYIVGIVTVGILSVKKIIGQSSDDYFLAGRSLRWGVIGAALFASNISTIHIIGFAESGFTTGLLDGIFEWMAIPCLVFFGLFVAPFYFRKKISTIPEYFEKRFNSATRTFMVVFAILTALLIHIGISLYAGAEICKQFFGLDILPAIILISVLTAIYTVLGGLKAVVITETIQAGLLLGGAITITLFGLFALPEANVHNFAEFKALLKPDQLSMLRSPDSPNSGGIPWYAVLLGYPVLGIWYWCADQTIVQRALGARSQRDCRIGPMFTAILKLAPVFFMLLPGVIAYVIFSDIIREDTGQTLPIMINQLLPTGLKGLVIASLLAALMSSVAAALNSSSTLVSVDIFKRLIPKATDRQMVFIGRLTAVVVMVLAITWSTQAYRFGEGIIHTVNSLGAMIAPSICTVFLFGVFWKRGTEQAAVATFMIGLTLGILQFLLDIPLIGNIRIITDGLGIGFMMQIWWVFCICCLVFVVVSYLTPKPKPEQIANTWEAKHYFPDRKIKSIKDIRVIGICIVLILIVLWTFLEFIA